MAVLYRISTSLIYTKSHIGVHLFCPLSLFSVSSNLFTFRSACSYFGVSFFFFLHRKFFGSLVVVPVKFTFVHILWSLCLHSSDTLLAYEF